MEDCAVEGSGSKLNWSSHKVDKDSSIFGVHTIASWSKWVQPRLCSVVRYIGTTKIPQI